MTLRNALIYAIDEHHRAQPGERMEAFRTSLNANGYAVIEKQFLKDIYDVTSMALGESISDWRFIGETRAALAGFIAAVEGEKYD